VLVKGAPLGNTNAAKDHASSGDQANELRAKADELKQMSSSNLDDLDPFEFGYRAYVLYEAEKIMPKKEDTMKSATDNNSFKLAEECDAVANIGGKAYLATKYEDPDDDEDKGVEGGVYVWHFQDPANPHDTIGFQTSYKDKAEAITQFKDHLKGTSKSINLSTMLKATYHPTKSHNKFLAMINKRTPILAAKIHEWMKAEAKRITKQIVAQKLLKGAPLGNTNAAKDHVSGDVDSRRTRKDYEEADGKGAAIWNKADKIAASMSMAQRLNLREYSYKKYKIINSQLRNPPPSTSTQQFAASIDKAFDKAGVATSSDMTVYRAGTITTDQLSELRDAMDNGASAQLTDNAYKSTSLSQHVADNFVSGNKGSGVNVKMHILVPKGTKTLPMKSFTYYVREKEILLDRGGKYSVDSIEKNQLGHYDVYARFEPTKFESVDKNSESSFVKISVGGTVDAVEVGRNEGEADYFSGPLTVVIGKAKKTINLSSMIKAKKKTPKEIVDDLDLSSWDVLAGIITDDTFDTFKTSYERGLSVAGLSEADITKQVDVRATAWSAQRSAELVGKRIDEDGNIIDNPDSEWSIDESTRDMLRATIEQSITDGDSADMLAQKIEDSAAFSDTRATNIARTELANAHMQGNLEGWKGSGVVIGKRSVLGSAHDIDDECDMAAEDGVIGIDETFSNGYDAPPYHPNCVCDLVPVLDEGDDESEKMIKLLTDDQASDHHKSPSQAQINSGNYKKGHLNINGIKISIENSAGTKRNPAWPELKHHYGYIKGTVGADGDHTDCFVRTQISKDYDGNVYVVNQTKADGSFDEHKCMIGWPTEADAKSAYLENYTKGWDRIDSIKVLTFEEFRNWVKTANHKHRIL
jgi:hypothetical protein